MISIIIPAWNGAKFIEACLSSIASQLLPDNEIIVVDNGSTDGTPAMVERGFPGAQVLRLERNWGFAGGINHGLRRAQGDVLILVNQDIVLLPGCLSALQTSLQANGPAIIGCKLLYPDGQTIQHAGGIIQMPRGLPSHFGYRQIDRRQWDTLTEVDYVTGALFVFDQTIFNTVGLFDEGFYPAYYEEVDYCYRAREAGFPVIYEPGAVAIHHESQTQDRHSVAYRRIMEYHRVRFMLKHSPPEQLQRDFFPAERDYMQRLSHRFARMVFARAYLCALLDLPDAAWLRFDIPSRSEVLDALADLYRLACRAN